MNEHLRGIGGLACFLEEWCEDDSGVTSIEYGLIGVLIAVVVVGAVTTVGVELKAIYDYVAACVGNLQCPP